MPKKKFRLISILILLTGIVYTQVMADSGMLKRENITLVYPWVSNNAGNFESLVIANNLSSSEQEVILTARRSDGSEETKTVIIPARGFLKEQASELFPALGNGSGYTVTLTAQTDKIRGSWVTNNLTALSGKSPSQGIAVRIDTPDVARSGEDIVFGYLPVGEGFFSAPVVVNTGSEPTDVRINFYSSSGSLVAFHEEDGLFPLTPLALIANDLTTGSNAEIVYARAFADQPMTGVSFVFNEQGETAIGNATSISSKISNDFDKPLVFPWISNNDGAFQSVIYINNISSQSSRVELTARRADGESETVTRTIPSNGSMFADASTLFTQLGSGNGYTVTTEYTCLGRCIPQGILTGGWVTNNLQAASGRSPSQGTAIDPNLFNSERYGEDLLFNYLPLEDQFISAPVLVNLGDDPVDVRLHYFDAQGNPIQIDNPVRTNLMPGEPFTELTNAMVPENTGDVMLIVDSDGGKLTGVSFVFNTVFTEPAIGNATKITWEE